MTDAGGKLARSVTLRDNKFRLVTFTAGSTPPAWARTLITNPSAWASAPIVESAPEPEGPGDEGGSPEGTQEDAPPATEDTPPADAPDADEEPEEDLLGELPEPPKRGAGSGRPAWIAYADSKGVKYADDASRDEVIAAVEASTE